jgi:hypothetical protein
VTGCVKETEMVGDQNLVKNGNLYEVSCISDAEARSTHLSVSKEFTRFRQKN